MVMAEFRSFKVDAVGGVVAGGRLLEDSQVCGASVCDVRWEGVA